MKGFQKLALVTAIAAAPFAAQAEMVAIDDSMLSDMTGQAGVSIELSAQLSIGDITYTDTDGGDSAVAGTVGISNVVLGGNGSSALDDIKIDIDVDGTDGLKIHVGGTNNDTVLDGTNPVDFGLAIGSVDVNSTAVLLSNLSIGGNLGPADITISNSSVIGVDAYFEITTGSLNVDVLGVGISGLTVSQDSDAFVGNQDSAAFGGLAGVSVNDAAAAAGAAATITDDGLSGGVAGDGLDDTSGLTLVETQAATADATKSAMVTGFEGAYGTGLSNMAHVAMTIQTADTSYTSSTGAQTDITAALSVSVDSMSMDIGIADVTVGGNSIGSLSINDLDLSGTSMVIYGH